MANFLKDLERIAKDRLAGQYEVLEYYYGVLIDVFEIDRNEHTAVYGKFAGRGESSKVATIIGILSTDNFFASDSFYSGGFEEMYLYTASEVSLVGRIIKTHTEDGKQRNFRVERAEAIGITTDVFRKYKISNLAD